MTERSASAVLWLIGAAFAPLPYLIFATGHVPVARFLYLAGVSGRYALAVDGSEVAWPMTLILLLHGLGYAAVLAVAARFAARRVPVRSRTATVAIVGVVAVAVCCSVPVYRTPMDDLSPTARWTELFQ